MTWLYFLLHPERKSNGILKTENLRKSLLANVSVKYGSHLFVFKKKTNECGPYFTETLTNKFPFLKLILGAISVHHPVLIHSHLEAASFALVIALMVFEFLTGLRVPSFLHRFPLSNLCVRILSIASSTLPSSFPLEASPYV